jgi:hypothetical protein
VRLGETEYAELVDRVCSAVCASVPPGASLLVVSKGDQALVEIPGMSAGHFPQDRSGAYAGYHPRDGAEAVAELQRLRRGGAEYLIVPVTMRWWLEFYTGLAQHLSGCCELVADLGDSCLIYRLERAVGALDGVAFSRPHVSVEQIRDFLESLLSADTQVAVLETDSQMASLLDPLPAVSLTSRELESGEDQRALADLAERGIGYLVVPRSADEWLQANPELLGGIEASCRRVADQRHLCRVYELGEAGAL